MGLVSTLKSILGFDSDDAGRRRGDDDVTVEREADAGSEHAVKEGSTATDEADDGGAAESDGESSDTGAADEETATGTTDEETATGTADEETPAGTADEETPAAETDAAASTESLVDEAETQAEAAGRAEPAEAAGPESEAESTDVEEAGPDDEGDAAAEGVDVQAVSGIGPAYADRLAEIDIRTVEELVDADPEEVAERTTVGAGRVRTWQERAADRED